MHELHVHIQLLLLNNLVMNTYIPWGPTHKWVVPENIRTPTTGGS